MRELEPKDIPGLYAKHGSLKNVARATDKTFGYIQRRYRKAIELGLMEHVPLGRKSADHIRDLAKPPQKQRVKALKPKKKRAKYYILTSAQNNTDVHASFHSMKAYAEFLGAEFYVSTFLYAKRGLGANNDKSKLNNQSQHPLDSNEIWFDPAIVPFINNDRVEIAKALMWCGEGNTLPTAGNPLTGMEVYTARASMIYPHAKQEVEPIATVERGKAKLNYTTGTCTLRNYIQGRAGLIAEFFHTYGGLIVGTDDKGHWWVRQLHADSDGVIYDWDKKITPDGKVVNYLDAGERPIALVAGDVHVANIDPAVRDATWAAGGLIDELKPQHQIIHDVFDGYARSHHAMKHAYKMLVRYFKKMDSVANEVLGVAKFLTWIKRDDTKTIIVNSNHDRHLARWLEENDGRYDPVNAVYWSQLNASVVEFIETNHREPDALKLAICEGYDFEFHNNALFLDYGASFVLAGTELGMHGDMGRNGSRGSLKQFAKMGRKSITAHDHTGGLKGGAAKAGTNSIYDLEYAINGPSSWTQTDVLMYPNGKVTLLTFYAGAWREPK